MVLAPGDRLTLLDPCGEQVSDLYLVAADDPAEVFSSGRTTDFGNSVYVSTGSSLWSNRSRVLAEVVDDSVGTHDLTLTPCSQETFDVLYPEFEGAPHPSCFANLVGALGPHGVDPDRIGTTLNVFMDVWTDDDGELHIDPPPPGPATASPSRRGCRSSRASPRARRRSRTTGRAPRSTCVSNVGAPATEPERNG